MNNNPGDETDRRRQQLSGIADRHLERLQRLPFNDQLTVATTILGSLVMNVQADQKLPLFAELAKGIRLHLMAGGVD